MNKERWVILLMYDLPSKNGQENKRATTFMKSIRRIGYIRLQKSVYIKLLRNKNMVCSEISKLKYLDMNTGNIKALPMRLYDFNRIVSISGDQFEMSDFSDDVAVM